MNKKRKEEVYQVTGNRNVLLTFGLVLLFSLLLLSLASATLNVSLSDQGSQVTNTSSGALLTSGNLVVAIYDALTGGNLIYTETFTNAIGNGSWNVMLGEVVNLPLEFGRIYYKDYTIAGEDASFTNGTGQTVGRQFFYSPLGDINSSKLFGDMIGATSSTAGATGILPAPTAGQQGFCLKGDGSWGSCSTDFSCPTGFTMIQNNGYQMGCMQNDEQGTGDWSTAANSCFTTYGGRLPSNSELHVAFQNYALSNENDDKEWIDVVLEETGSQSEGAYWDGPNLKFWGVLWTTNTLSYRCFIPASGGGGGTLGYVYIGDVKDMDYNTGSIIEFDSVNASQGLITDITANTITLLAGKTYMLQAGIQGGFSGIGSFSYRFYDGTAYVGTSATSNTATQGSDNADQETAFAIVTPSVNTDYTLKIPSADGALNSIWVGQSYISVIEIGVGGDSAWSENSTSNDIYYTGGNVGINTTNPEAALHVSGGHILLDNNFHLQGKDSGGTPRTLVGTNGDDMLVGDTTRTGHIRFYANGAERLLLASGGQGYMVGLGDSNAGHYMCWNTGNGELMHSASTCSGSSLRYKDNVIDYQYGLNELMRLRPVSFEYNYEKGVARSGLIAEEVEDIIPELVDYDEEGRPNSLFYQDMSSLYINAIQELKQENDALREELCEKDPTYTWC